MSAKKKRATIDCVHVGVVRVWLCVCVCACVRACAQCVCVRMHRPVSKSRTAIDIKFYNCTVRKIPSNDGQARQTRQLAFKFKKKERGKLLQLISSNRHSILGTINCMLIVFANQTTVYTIKYSFVKETIWNTRRTQPR